MKFTTFAFPTMIDRINGRTRLSIEEKSVNECLGILLRTRPPVSYTHLTLPTIGG